MDTETILTNLSREYRRQAGERFADGDDAGATALRTGADKIDELRKALPPLPMPKVTYRG